MAFSDFIQYEDIPPAGQRHDQHTFDPTRFAFYRDAHTPHLDGILNKHLKENAAVFQAQSSGGIQPPPPTVPPSGPTGFPSTPTVTGPTSVPHHGYRQSQRPYRQPRGDPTHLVRTKIQAKQTRTLAVRTRTQAQLTRTLAITLVLTVHRRIGLQ